MCVFGLDVLDFVPDFEFDERCDVPLVEPLLEANAGCPPRAIARTPTPSIRASRRVFGNRCGVYRVLVARDYQRVAKADAGWFHRPYIADVFPTADSDDIIVSPLVEVLASD